METNDILAELHRIKDELSAECDYDIDKLFDRLRETERTSGRTYVSYVRNAERSTPAETVVAESKPAVSPEYSGK